MNSTTKKPRKNILLETQISQDNRQSHRQRLHNVKSQQTLHSLQRTTIDQLKMQQSLLRQLQQVKQIIIKYTNQLDNKSYVSLSSNSLNSNKISNTNNTGISSEQYVHMMEELHKNIEIKNVEINSINQEIKMLKTTKDTNRNNRLKNNPYAILAEEICKQKEELLQFQKKHQEEKKELMKNRIQMKQKLEIYHRISASFNANKRLINYAEFTHKRKCKLKQDKERDDSNYKSRKVSKKHLPATKEALDSEDQNKYIVNSTNLTDAENKKKVAEGALRTAKKTHRAEMAHLNGKLQFLYDEHVQLSKKLQSIQKQLGVAEQKFKQAKQNPITSSNNVKIARYSQPQSEI